MSRRITHAVGGGRTVDLTTTQHSAYGDLIRFGQLIAPWGNQACSRGTVYGYGAKTLQALVDAGLAEWRTISPESSYLASPRAIVRVGQNVAEHAATARRERVQAASLYVTTRFFPPLPAEYGDLAVTALDAYAEQGPGATVVLPAGLNPKPRAARYDGDREAYVVDAGDLIDILRIGHMVEDFD